MSAESTAESEAPLAASEDGPENMTSAEHDMDKEKQKEKRRLFGLLKKKDNSKDKSGPNLSPDATPTASPPSKATIVHSAMAPATTTTTTAKSIPRSISPVPQPHMTPPLNAVHGPTSSPQQYGISAAAASPSRYVRSSSPRLHSPASSLIFERNVQEAPLPDDLQAAIPHHIQTEDYIPPTLEASSLAITDEKLNPDEVEIVTHAAHQPAANSIAHHEGSFGGGLGSGALSPLSLDNSVPTLSPSAVLSDSTTPIDEQSGSHYGSIDATDVRRLSFISFADVVQGEHVHDNASLLPRDMHMSMISSTTNRSPSPVRSPASSHGAGDVGLSPPTSGAPSVKGVEIGKQQSTIGAFPASPGSLTTVQSNSLPGDEITVETMRQALRKMGSGDLSHTMSPISPVERSSVFPVPASPEMK